MSDEHKMKKHTKKKCKSKRIPLIPDNCLLRGKDMENVRVALGVDRLGLVWLSGSLANTWTATGPKSEAPLKSISMSILLRFLSTYPSYAPSLPEMPLPTELFEMLQDFPSTVELLPKNPLFANRPPSFTWRRFPLLLGKSYWAGTRWKDGYPASCAASRLLYVLKTALEVDGDIGLQRFLEIVDIEARARGIRGGLEEALMRGNWTDTETSLEREAEKRAEREAEKRKKREAREQKLELLRQQNLDRLAKQKDEEIREIEAKYEKKMSEFKDEDEED